MTTTISGGKISCRIALTMQAQSALTFNSPIKIVGDYLCDLGDAADPCIGFVVTPNVARGTGALAGTYPQTQVPGDVAVEAFGHGVGVVLAGAGGVAAGNAIKIGAGGTYIVGAGPADASFVGWALTTASAGNNFDILWV